MESLHRDCLPFRLASAYRRVDRLLNRAFKPLGLTHAHGHVLVCILEAGELRVSGIAARTGFEASTVSRLVKELARRKLVRRSADPDDGRAALLRPATRALRMRADIERVVQRAHERLRRDLPDADLEGFLNTTGLMDRLP